ncbi:unnamed protein product [Hydatigera taeniaeformis]|uniref:Transmembrane protein n=1 Tax=Hydatigena taeniaeformis TaxID=6205 RepID=A0A0R3WWR1_HYDTA|nr:unnamed protein product [Hydatigera taeniaeformis]
MSEGANSPTCTNTHVIYNGSRDTPRAATRASGQFRDYHPPENEMLPLPILILLILFRNVILPTIRLILKSSPLVHFVLSLCSLLVLHHLFPRTANKPNGRCYRGGNAFYIQPYGE